MADFHQMVIHHIGQMIGRHAICFKQYLQINLRPVNADLAAQHIVKGALPFSGHIHAHHMGFTLG